MGKNIAFMEFLRGSLALSAANTYTEIEIKTPVGRSDRLAMLIHKIEFSTRVQLDIPVHNDSVSVHVSRNSKAAITGVNDSDIIARFGYDWVMATSGAHAVPRSQEIEFQPAVLYAKSSMFIGGNTSGQTNPMTIDFRIGYTIQAVPQEAFLEALVD